MKTTKEWQSDPRFRNLEKKVGLFVFIALGVLAGIIFFMGREMDLFSKKYTLFFNVDSGSGFIEGIPVKLLGFKIGKVKRLSLTEEAKVKVTLEINKKYQKWIRRGSVARLIKEGVIGDAVVEVTVGPASGAMIEDEREIAFEKVGGIEELAQEVKPVLQDIKETIHYINDPEGDIKKSLANIKKLSQGLLQTKEHLDEVLKEAKVTIKEATSAFTKLDGIGEKAGPVVDKANKALDKVTVIATDAEAAMKKLPQVMEKVDDVMDDVKQFSDVLSKRSRGIAGMLEDTENMLNDTKEIIKGAKETWPISSMVPPREDLKIAPLDGSGKTGESEAGVEK